MAPHRYLSVCPGTFWTKYLQDCKPAYLALLRQGVQPRPDRGVVLLREAQGFDGVSASYYSLDFPMNSAIREVDPARISEENRRCRARPHPHPELLVTFIGNHDMKRFVTDAGGSTAKIKLSFSLLATIRGIPQIYSGDEIAMSGGNDDPDNRRDFPGGFPGDQHNAFTQSGRTPDEQDVYAHVQGLLKLRRDHPALRIGEQKHTVVTDDYYLFTRESLANA